MAQAPRVESRRLFGVELNQIANWFFWTTTQHCTIRVFKEPTLKTFCARIGHERFSVSNVPVFNIYTQLGARFGEPMGCWLWVRES